MARNENGSVSVNGMHVHHRDEDHWSDDRLADLSRRDAAARALAPSLIGLTVGAAQAMVDQHPGVSVLFTHPGRGHRTIGVFGQIRAKVENDVVVSAH